MNDFYSDSQRALQDKFASRAGRETLQPGWKSMDVFADLVPPATYTL